MIHFLTTKAALWFWRNCMFSISITCLWEQRWPLVKSKCAKLCNLKITNTFFHKIVDVLKHTSVLSLEITIWCCWTVLLQLNCGQFGVQTSAIAVFVTCIVYIGIILTVGHAALSLTNCYWPIFRNMKFYLVIFFTDLKKCLLFRLMHLKLLW